MNRINQLVCPNGPASLATSPALPKNSDRLAGAGRGARPALSKGQRAKATQRTAARSLTAGIDTLSTEIVWERFQVAKASEDPKAEERIRNVLMERHLKLVKQTAERLLKTLPNSVELDDLVSAGLFGLLDAIRGFDPSRGFKFKTYCTARIRGSILDQLRTEDWVPRLVRRKAGRIEKVVVQLTAELGREPNHDELATALEMNHQQLGREIQKASATSMYSLSGKPDDSEGESAENGDGIQDKAAIDPLKVIRQEDMLSVLTDSLSDRERFIVNQYYVIGHTFREIGELLKLTESRVCQVHTNIMAHLKQKFGTRQATLLM